MDIFDVELESAQAHGFAALVPAYPGLIVFGATLDEVLDHARLAIAYRLGSPAGEPVRLRAVPSSRPTGWSTEAA
jgi:predicted RNase H-like HicB family nuclease